MLINIKKIIFIITLLFLIAGCSMAASKEATIDEPPEISVKVGNEDVEAVMGSFNWNQGESRGDSIKPSELIERMNLRPTIVAPKSEAEITFDDDSDPQIKAYLWVNDKRDKQLATKQNRVILPSEAGKHVIEIQSTWPKNRGETIHAIYVEVK